MKFSIVFLSILLVLVSVAIQGVRTDASMGTAEVAEGSTEAGELGASEPSGDEGVDPESTEELIPGDDLSAGSTNIEEPAPVDDAEGEPVTEDVPIEGVSVPAEESTKEASTDMAAYPADGSAPSSDIASVDSPQPPSLYSNAPPGAADDFECIEEGEPELAQDCEEEAVGGVDLVAPPPSFGQGCGVPVIVKETLVVTKTKVMPVTCTLTETKVVAQLTTLTEIATKIQIQTKVVKKIATVVHPVTVTVSVIKTLEIPAPTHFIAPIQTDYVEYEHEVGGDVAIAPAPTPIHVMPVHVPAKQVHVPVHVPAKQVHVPVHSSYGSGSPSYGSSPPSY